MAWARHRLRTARSSPLRLFTAGSLNCPVDMPDADLDMYGVEGNIELNSAEMNDTRPALGALDLQITDDCRQELDRYCSPNWNSNNYGIDIYIKAVEIIGRQML
ncbi:hypothetical protein DPMN_133516 [Dreissena polymorpha]|uniref:Uncharacterized protein n=1 Tax=Dreissena polymorpha TaxID=45954 RepID=A0A9D4JCZ3_DREPO|nr:hypothetical protein DPMN_133516 [Dreissena polymorpha]